MRLETYDAYVLLEQLLGEAQAELESAGFATRMVMPDTFCRVRVDVPYFKRVLDNLFANVRKYADPAQPVSIAALPENRTLHICICNTIRADSGQVESNKIGLRTAEKIPDADGRQLPAATRRRGSSPPRPSFRSSRRTRTSRNGVILNYS